MIPDPTVDPTATVSLLSHLYSTGALFCLGVVAVYIALKYASKHVAWLEVPGRAHYVTVALAVLAVFALPASQGTTPNTSMLMVAFGTAMSLLLPGATSSSKAPQAGFARFDVMFTLAALAGAAFAWIVAIHLTGCATLKSDAIVAGSAFAACGEKDASGLFSQVGTIVESNSGNLESQLTSLAASAGIDAVKCAIAAVDAVIGQSGSAISTSAANPGLLRAKAWAAKQ